MRYFIGIILIIIVWVGAGSIVVETKNITTFGVKQVILWPRWWIQGLINPALEQKKYQELVNQYEDVRAQLFQLQNTLPNSTTSPALVHAKIHATYPFNNKHLISINVGQREGVRVGMPVTIEKATLLGKIKETFERYSLVETIFSREWQLPVRIGNDGVEALFNGGSEPTISLIVKEDDVADGQIIYTASNDMPYGLTIGRLSHFDSELSPEAFRVGGVKVSYSLIDLTDVWVHLSF